MRVFASIVREGEPGTRCLNTPAAAIAAIVALQRAGVWPVDEEALGVLLLDVRRNLIGTQIVSRGTPTASLCRPADVLRPAIVLAAPGFIVAHNHPSGDVTPSPDDEVCTERIRAAAEMFGIDMADSIIVGRPGVKTAGYSFCTGTGERVLV